ncbi:hypothetical protein [Mucilaginibacter sp.]|uniref:hypothetical protein n=1 Tax=Mucilaginibacter sp. TaxID=1882438 RepID=UPI0026212156|nr:hypothetical protein [Mucilaginibacter sp.]
MEIIPNDTTKPYFKRIEDENRKLFPIIIAPGEYKTINLIGDNKHYSKGMLEYTPYGPKFREITRFDSLHLVKPGDQTIKVFANIKKCVSKTLPRNIAKIALFGINVILRQAR